MVAPGVFVDLADIGAFAACEILQRCRIFVIMVERVEINRRGVAGDVAFGGLDAGFFRPSGKCQGYHARQNADDYRYQDQFD